MDPPAVIVVALILCAWAYCACLLPLAAGQDSPAPDITYHVRNKVADTVVGKRFDQLFGGGRMEQLMSDATAAVWETFEIHHYPENTNFFTDVYLTLNNLSSVPDQVAGWIDNDNEIVLNSWFFSGPYVRDNGGMEPWVQSTVYHEMTHVWQVYKGYTSKEGRALQEGMATYVSKRAGHPSPECVLWYPLLRRRDWRQGYCVTMYFLRYFYFLGGDAIVAEINRRLNDHGYKEDDFVDLLGSTPDELWRQFLATLPAGPNIGLLQLVAGRNKAATMSYIY